MPKQRDQKGTSEYVTADLDRTTAAIFAADQAHLARMHDDTIWAREGFLGHLVRDEWCVDRRRRPRARRSPV